MSATPRINLVGFYNFDDALFQGIGEIDGIDRRELVNSILLTYGEMPVLYTDLPFMKSMIDIWWKKWEKSFIRIYEAISAEYNPIHNYDRYEEYDDEETGNKNGTNKIKNKTDSQSKTDMRDNVSAFNEDSYSKDRQNVGDSSGSTDSQTDGTSSENSARTFKHRAHLYGNIGVTTSSAMVSETMELFKGNNIYDIIAGIFAEEFLLKIY